MRRDCKRNCKGRENGYALVAVLLILLLGAVLGMGLLAMTLNSHQAVLANEHHTRAKYLAEYGAMVGLNELEAELKRRTDGRTLSCNEADNLVRKPAKEFEYYGYQDKSRSEEAYTYTLAFEEAVLQEARQLCEKNSPLELVTGALYVVEGKLIASGYVHKDALVPGKATVEVPVQITNLAKVFDYALAARENMWLNGGAVIDGNVYVGRGLAVHPWVHYPLWYQLKLLGKLGLLLNLNNLLNPGQWLSQIVDALLGGLLDLLGLDLSSLIEKLLNLNELLQTLFVVDIGHHGHGDLYPKIDGTVVTGPNPRFYHINDDSHCANVGREIGYAVVDLLENLTNVLKNLLENLLRLDSLIQGLQHVLFGGGLEAGMHSMKEKFRTDAEQIREERLIIGEYQFSERSDVEFPSVNMRDIKNEVAKKAGVNLRKLNKEWEKYGPEVHAVDTRHDIMFHYVTGLEKKCVLLLLCSVKETKTAFSLDVRHNPGSGQHVYYIHGDLIVEGDDLNLGAVFYVNGDVEFRNVKKSTNVVAGTIVVNGDVRIANVDKPLQARVFIWQNNQESVVALYGVESAVHLYGGILAQNLVLNGARDVPKGEYKQLVYDPDKDDFVYKQGSSQGEIAPPLLYIQHDDQFLRTPPPGVPTHKGLYVLQLSPWTYVETKE